MAPPDASEQSGGDEDDGDEEEQFPIGTYAIDREDPDPNLAIVINRPPVPGEEWVAYHTPETGEVTVAEDNPEYDPEAEVVVVAFYEEFVEAHREWTPDDGPFPLGEAEVTTYAFPPGRLEVADPEEWSVDTDALGADTDSTGTDDSKKRMAAITPGSDDEDTGEDTEDDVAGDEDGEDAEPEPEPEPEPPELDDEMADLRDRLAENATVDVRRGEEGQPVLEVSKLGDSYEVQPDGTISGEGVLRSRLDDVVGEYLGD